MIKPLHVIDDADERTLLRDLSEQRQRGKPHQEPVGRRPSAPAEHRRQRVTLRTGQQLELAEHGAAELVQAAVGELHLGLDPDRTGDVPAGNPPGKVAKQRALADARLASQHDYPTRARKNIVD